MAGATLSSGLWPETEPSNPNRIGDELIGVSMTGGVVEVGRDNRIGADIEAADRDRNDDSDLFPNSRLMEGLFFIRVDPERQRFGVDLRDESRGAEGNGTGGEARGVACSGSNVSSAMTGGSWPSMSSLAGVSMNAGPSQEVDGVANDS